MNLPPRPKTVALSATGTPSSPSPGASPSGIVGKPTQVSPTGKAPNPYANRSPLGGTLVIEGDNGSPEGSVPPGASRAPLPEPSSSSYASSSLTPVASDVESVPASIDENVPTLARPEMSSLSAPRSISAQELGLGSLNEWADQSSANVLAGSRDHSLSGEQESISVPPPGSRLDPYVGTTIDGRYKIESILGEGGMGVVYASRHKVINKRVAIKVLRADLSRDHEMTERFLIEAQAASSIGHPHIVDVSDYGTMPDGSAYFVMEFLEGRSLTGALEENDRKPLSTARIIHISKQIADGLHAAHAQGIVHRDLKPDNVFIVARAQEKEFIKLLDFGIAKVATSSEAKLTRAGTVFGTPHYMSPEQAAGAPVDHRTDIYSLGVILYEMASGKVPFDADNYMGILTQHMYKAPVPIYDLLPAPEIPRPLEAIILKLLLKKPEQRYQTMLEVVADLERLEKGQMPEAVSEMMARSGVFNIPTDYFDTKPSIHNITAGAPAEKRKRWGVIAGLAGIVAAVAIVALILSFGSASNATVTTPSASAAIPVGAPAASATTAPAVVAPPVKPSKTVQVIAVPLDAEVFVGGEKVSKSPAVLSVPEGEKLTVEVRLEGFATKEIVVDGKRARVEVKLTKLPTKGGGAKSSGGSDVTDPWAKKRRP